MMLKKDDPLLVDYVLGELDQAEVDRIFAALSEGDNGDALAEIAALRGTVDTLRQALAEEPATECLAEEQRDAVLRWEEVGEDQREDARIPWWKGLWTYPVQLITAASVIAIVVFWVGGTISRSLDRHQQAESAPQPTASTAADAQAEPLVVAANPVVPAKPERKAGSGLQNVEIGGSIRVHGNFYDESQASQLAAQGQQIAPDQAQVHTWAAPREVNDLSFSYGFATGGGGGFGGGGFGGGRDELRMGVPRSFNTGIVGSSAVVLGDSTEPLRYWWYSPGPQGSGFQNLSTLLSSGEAYASIVENPFARVTAMPLSTFGIDVDTASYSNVRRFLQQGSLPPADAVRIEELINYFAYAYPEPAGPHPVSVHAESGTCPWAPDHLLAKIGLQAKDVPRDARPAANLVFLLDVSGSMKEPNKLPLVKESMKALLRELDEGDRVAIVTYASTSAVALPSTPAPDSDRILAAIEGLSAGGSTHGSAGIQDAYDIAQQHFIEDGVNRVILATDGDFNVGVTDLDDLVRMIEAKRQSNIFLTALGFGMGNLKDATLEQLADKGNGNYAYIDDFGEARKVLADELMGTLFTVAKDVKIQVEFNPAQVQAYRLIGYENRALVARDFNDDRKDAGEIGAGHSVTALYEIVPVGVPIEPGVDGLRYQSAPAADAVGEAPDAGTPHGDEMMLVKLRYKLPDGDASTKIEVPVEKPQDTPDLTPDDLRFAAAVAAFGLVLRDSQYKGSADYDLVIELAEGALRGPGFKRLSPENQQERKAFVDLAVAAKTLSDR